MLIYQSGSSARFQGQSLDQVQLKTSSRSARTNAPESKGTEDNPLYPEDLNVMVACIDLWTSAGSFSSQVSFGVCLSAAEPIRQAFYLKVSDIVPLGDPSFSIRLLSVRRHIAISRAWKSPKHFVAMCEALSSSSCDVDRGCVQAERRARTRFVHFCFPSGSSKSG